MTKLSQLTYARSRRGPTTARTSTTSTSRPSAGSPMPRRFAPRCSSSSPTPSPPSRSTASRPRSATPSDRSHPTSRRSRALNHRIAYSNISLTIFAGAAASGHAHPPRQRRLHARQGRARRRARPGRRRGRAADRARGAAPGRCDRGVGLVGRRDGHASRGASARSILRDLVSLAAWRLPAKTRSRCFAPSRCSPSWAEDELARVAEVAVPRQFVAGRGRLPRGRRERHVLRRAHRPSPRRARAPRRPLDHARQLRSRRHLRRAGDVRRRAALGDDRDARGHRGDRDPRRRHAPPAERARGHRGQAAGIARPAPARDQRAARAPVVPDGSEPRRVGADAARRRGAVGGRRARATC